MTSTPAGHPLGRPARPVIPLDRTQLTVNELMRARYRHHLATGFMPDLAVALAEWDVVGYLRNTNATRTDRDAWQ